MPIYLFCPTCKLTLPLDSKSCPKCKTVFQTQGKKYRVRVMVAGQTVSRLTDHLTLAREIEASLKADMVRGVFVGKKKTIPTLGEVWAKYLPWARENKKTWRDDQYYYEKHIGPRFAATPLDKITAFDLEKMKIEMGRGQSKRNRPFARATVKHQLVIIRRLFNIARKWGLYAGDNPVSRVSLPKLDNQVTEYFSDEETERLLGVLDEWPFRDSACFVKFAMLTGFRRGELFKLRWEDIDFEHRLATLLRPKGGKTVTLPVSEAALDVLRELPVESEFVFPGKGGKQRTDFSGPWRRIRKAAGLPENFRFHGLRHNYASRLVSAGVDLGVVSKLLSHKDLVTTQRYAHFAPTVLQAGADKAAEAILPKTAGKGNVESIQKPA